MPTAHKFTVTPTPEQRAIIDHPGGHLQVIACAGAGKTEAISQRVAKLIKDGTSPPQIVAFTFTERAAASLKNRIVKRVAEAMGDKFLDRLGPMYVGTIHAYCLRLLQDHVPEFGNFDILDENRLAGLLSREEKRLNLKRLSGTHWKSISEFLRNANVVENELIDPKDLGDSAFGDCYRQFHATLLRYRYLTYGLLISCAVEAMQRPAVAKRVHERLRYLIVDEYQDINPAQEKLIRLLVKPPVELCVVADDDQAIYQWRGSDVAIMQDFPNRYRGAKSLPLSENRRSRPTIISTANAFSKTIEPRLKKAMKPVREPGDHEVVAWSAPTDVREAQVIADTIESLVTRGFRYRDIAVLFRSVRTSAPLLLQELKKRDVPFRCAGRAGLFQQPEAQLMGQAYAWLCDQDWKSDPYGQSAPVDIDQLIAALRSVFPSAESKKELKGLFDDWKNSVPANTSPVNLVRDYYFLLHKLGVRDWDLNDPVMANRMGTLARFSQLLADIEHVTRRARYVAEESGEKYRGGTDRGIHFYRRLFNYLQFYALDAYAEFEGEESYDQDAVDILTIHQAKGLEWPVVFLPSLVDGRFPSKYAGKQQNWLVPDRVFKKATRQRYEGSDADERRLFYVGMTRARDVLYLSRFEKKTNRFKISPFLLDVAGTEPPLRDKLPIPLSYTPPVHAADELPTVSFSDLAYYERCPLRYRLSTVLGFQPQLATELGYGRAIHHILRHVAELTKAKRTLPTDQEIEAIFDEHFYLPFANRPLFENLLDRAHKLIQKYMTSHGSDMLRVWETERPFELHLGKANVTGRADVILDREGGAINNLAIVDYKTANETKGDDLYAFQLQIYAAAGRGEGLNVVAARVHHLKDVRREEIPIDAVHIRTARAKAEALVLGIVEREFPHRPDKQKCKSCDVRAICKHADCSKYDL